jgi:EF hand
LVCLRRDISVARWALTVYRKRHTNINTVLSPAVAHGAYSFAKPSARGRTMLRQPLMSATMLALLACGAQAQTSNRNAFATGNPMHFDAKAMDTNGDGMITKEEMMAYAEKMWDMMANGHDTIRISRATKDFATGGLAFNAAAMDTDHDGTISKQEFLAYAEHKFDKMAHPNGMISVQEAARAFARGNTPPSK